MSLFRRLLIVSGLLILPLLAACDPTPSATQDPSGRFSTPTVSAPQWVEAAGPVNAENIAQISYLGRLDAPGDPSTIFTYSFSPDNTRLAALNNEQLVAWDLITGRRVFSTARVGATEVYYSPDKSEIYTLDNLGSVVVYEAESGRQQNDFQAHTAYNNSKAYESINGYLTVGGSNGEVKVWDVIERQSLVSIPAHRLGVTSLVFSADGQWLVSAGEENSIKLWDWRNKQEIASFQLPSGEPAYRLAISPDATQVAVGLNQTVILLAVPDMTEQFTLPTGDGGATDVLRYSPDGSYLVNSGGMPEMSVWNPVTGEQVAALPGIGGDRTSAAFSSDGDLLLASVMSGPVTLWNMNDISGETLSRAELQVGADASTRILYVDWTSDGFLLTFFDAGGPVYVWGLKPAS